MKEFEAALRRLDSEPVVFDVKWVLEGGEHTWKLTQHQCNHTRGLDSTLRPFDAMRPNAQMLCWVCGARVKEVDPLDGKWEDT
jgi:hypothetical protein